MFHNICLFKGYKENGEWQNSVQGQTTEMFKKVTIFDGLKNANIFNIYVTSSSSRLSTGDPRNQDIFLQKTAFSLVMSTSRLALGSPGWFGARHCAKNGLTHRKMAVDCALVITSRGEALSGKRLNGQASLLQSQRSVLFLCISPQTEI